MVPSCVCCAHHGRADPGTSREPRPQPPEESDTDPCVVGLSSHTCLRNTEVGCGGPGVGILRPRWWRRSRWVPPQELAARGCGARLLTPSLLYIRTHTLKFRNQEKRWQKKLSVPLEAEPVPWCLSRLSVQALHMCRLGFRHPPWVPRTAAPQDPSAGNPTYGFSVMFQMNKDQAHTGDHHHPVGSRHQRTLW